jgi:hypothetical protein
VSFVLGGSQGNIKNVADQLSRYCLVHSLFTAELEGLYPEELEGIDAILDRTEQRIVRQRSLSSDKSFKRADTPTTPTDTEPTESVQQGGDTHHGRSSMPLRHTSLRERTLHNIAESDDVFLDENLTESLV